MLDFDYYHRDVLYRYVHDTLIGDVPIDYLEFGVYKDETMRSWASINRHPNSRFVGFDSFQGLPEEWRRGVHPKGTCNVDGVVPEIGDNRANLVIGMFQDTLPKFLSSFRPENRLVIHMDADLYSSTLFVLLHLNKIIRPGSILVFDEFCDLNHEFSAFHDFTKICYRDWSVICARPDFYKLAIEIK